MARFTIRFDEKTTNKLLENAEEKEVAVAYYIRSLVDIGLRVEEASKEKNSDNDSEKIKQELEMKSYKSSIETLLLVRRIAAYTNTSNENTDEILKHVSEKAQAYIDGLFGKDA